MKYCSNCGSKLTEDAEFCTECGQRVNSAPQTQPQTQAKPKKKWGPGKIILTVIGVICVLGIAGFVGMRAYYSQLDHFVPDSLCGLTLKVESGEVKTIFGSQSFSQKQLNDFSKGFDDCAYAFGSDGSIAEYEGKYGDSFNADAYVKKHSCGSYTVGKNSITINDNSESSPIKLEITNMTKSNGKFHGQFKATVSCDGGTAVIRGMATFWLAAD